MTSALERLTQIVTQLRGPNGCPWDKEQTFQSLIPCIIEEAYELVDAIESGNLDHLQEELGDVLLHVVMLCSIAQDSNAFNLDDVAHNVSEKMIRRHPHVFGDKKATTVEDVWTHWESIKSTEKNTTSIMDSVPKLPALLEAHKVQKKAHRVGFDWDSSEGALEKLDEELEEFKQVCLKKDATKMEDEAGDILFSIVNVFRKMDINAEEALRKSTKKFVTRFKAMETQHDGNHFHELSIDEMEALWKQVK